MSLTSSESKTNSATEALASRYRHLFVLPSTGVLLVYAGVLTLGLCLATSRTIIIPAFAFTYSVFLLSVIVISNALKLANPKTIGSTKRIIATMIAGEAVWLLLVTCGAIYALATSSPSALTDTVVFGAFVCAGLEFLIINGVFTSSAALSSALAAVFPIPMIAVVKLAKLTGSVGLGAVAAGALSFVTIAAFLPLLREKKTSHGQNSLNVFRAFMKTWVGGDSRELEGIISEHAETARVVTKVMRLKSGKGDMFVVLPGIHPGPFFPLGSYDLPGVISSAFKEMGPTMTLHRPGGHERNLTASSSTVEYARRLREFSSSIQVSVEPAEMRGPMRSEVGKATVNSWSFSQDMVATISFAPLGSDDLKEEVEQELGKLGRAAGLETWVVDAHNSIEPELETPDISDSGWRRLFELVAQAEARGFRVGYANSGELGFRPQGDLTENGVSLLMLETGGAKSVLLLADSNNSVPDLRAKTSERLELAGYHLIEFCTSDTHNLAAKGLTVARGYKALGEETPVSSLTELALGLAGLAETRLEPCYYGSGELVTEEKVFGAKAIDEFAALTQSSSAFAKKYFGFAACSVAALLIISLLL